LVARQHRASPMAAVGKHLAAGSGRRQARL